MKIEFLPKICKFSYFFSLGIIFLGCALISVRVIEARIISNKIQDFQTTKTRFSDYLKRSSRSGNFPQAFDSTSAVNAEEEEEEEEELENLLQQRKLTASDGAADDRFGKSAAMVGNKIIVGAFTDDVGANQDQGSAYIFSRNGANWVQEAKLTAPDGAAGDYFGWAVAFDGLKAVITAKNDDVGANAAQGAAYVFENTGGGQWVFRAKLTAADGAAGDEFGYSAAMQSPNQIFIGAIGDDSGAAANQGSVYVFGNQGAAFPQLAKLTSGDPAADDYFGRSIDYDGNTLVVGADGDDGPNGVPLNSGAIHVFTGSGAGWSFQARLTPIDPGTGDRLGFSTAISGNTIIAGAYGKNSDQGAAYIFTRNGAAWTQQAKLLPADVSANDRFGYSVAIDAGSAFAGAQTDTVTSSLQGSVYAFALNNGSWLQRDKLLASDAGDGDLFGESLAVWGNSLIVGAIDDTVGANARQGSVYVFPAKSAKFDFEGDGKADIAVFRPLNGTWHRLNSSNGQYNALQFGLNGDKPVPSDYDGDGETDIAVFRPSSGNWYWLNSSNNTFSVVKWGQNGDIPVPAFFRDNDFRADLTVFRPSDGNWYIYRSNGGGTTIIHWGLAGDIPLAADYFGEGLDNIGVFRPSNGTWYLRTTNNNLTAIQFGQAGDLPVPADYNGDGAEDIAVFRPSNGNWYIRNSNGSANIVNWGLSNDRPAPADFDGDGLANIAVFRPSNGAWYIKNADGTDSVTLFGTNGDRPAPSAFVP